MMIFVKRDPGRVGLQDYCILFCLLQKLVFFFCKFVIVRLEDARVAGRQRDQGGALGTGGLGGGRQGLSGSGRPDPVRTYTFISTYINRITNLIQHSGPCLHKDQRPCLSH